MATLQEFAASRQTAGATGLKAFTASKAPTEWKPISVTKTPTVTPTKTPTKVQPTNAPIKITPGAKKVDLNLLQQAQQTMTGVAQKVGGAIGKLASFLPEKNAPIKITPGQKKIDTAQLKQLEGYKSQQADSATLTTQAKEQTIQKLKAVQEKYKTKPIEQVRRQLPKGYKEPGALREVADILSEGITNLGVSGGASLEMIGNITNNMLVTESGKKIRRESENILAANPEWAADPAETWGARKLARVTLAVVPSILANVVARLVAGTPGTVATGFALEAGPTYKEAKEAGASETKAQVYGVTVGTVNGILESLFGKSILAPQTKVIKEGIKKIGKELILDFGKKVAKGAAVEATTEGLQETWSNVIATNYDKNRKVWDNVLESFVGGFLGGGVVGGGIESVQNKLTQNLQAENDPQTVINEVIKQKAENTEEGKALIKEAVIAQKTGEKVVIEKPVEKVKIVETSTPQGGVDIKPLTEQINKNLPSNINPTDIRATKIFGSAAKGGKYNDIDAAIFLDKSNPIMQKALAETGDSSFIPSYSTRGKVNYHIFENSSEGQQAFENFSRMVKDKTSPIGAPKGYDINAKTIDISQPSTPQGGVTTEETLYHGGKVDYKDLTASQAFDAIQRGDKELGSVAAEGPGIYLTNSENEAKGYGTNIQKLVKNEKANIIDKTSKKLTNAQIKKVINSLSSDDKTTVLSNWDMNESVAMNNLINAVKDGETTHEQLMNIWADVYNHQDPEAFVNAMKSLGIDGVKIEKPKGYHIIIYNKDAFSTKLSQETKVQPKEVSVPKQQLPVGEGKEKVSRLEARMKGVMDSATEEQIQNLGLTTYQQMNKKETIAKAAEYVSTNRDDAIKVLKGDLEAPKGIPPEALYIALTQASKEDATLITKLASLQATAIGQRLSLLTELDTDSPVKLLNEVYKIREEVAKKKYKNLKKVVDTGVENAKKEIKTVSKYDWNEFINNIDTC